MKKYIIVILLTIMFTSIQAYNISYAETENRIINIQTVSEGIISNPKPTVVIKAKDQNVKKDQTFRIELLSGGIWYKKPEETEYIRAIKVTDNIMEFRLKRDISKNNELKIPLDIEVKDGNGNLKLHIYSNEGYVNSGATNSY